MAETYMPTEDAKFAVWMQNFAQKFNSQYGRLLGYSDEVIKQVNMDAAAVNGAVVNVAEVTADKKEAVDWKNILFNGPETRESLRPMPRPTPPAGAAAAAIEAVPADARAGVKPRMRKLVKNIKSNTKYETSIGEDLGIIGPESEVDITALTPDIKLAYTPGRGVDIKWKKGVADGIRIEYADGSNWTFLATDTEPDYTDTRPVASPEKRTYKVQYFLSDELIGQPAIVAITVG